ncbi:MAG: glycoside hydrolase family 3 N-terminal domain-containing protein [Myxococcales bacterium]
MAAVLTLALASCSPSNSTPPAGGASSGGRVGGSSGGNGGTGAAITATGGAQGSATGGQIPGGSGGGGSSAGGASGNNATGTGGRASGATGGQAGNGAGGTGQGGGAVVSAGKFPSQACLDRATTLLGQMTADEKFAQMMQMERAALTPAMVTQYGVGSVFSQGGSGPATNSAADWADMTDSYRAAALASRLKIPIIYGADEVHGIGTVRGAVVFPHNIGLGATRDVALVDQIARVTAAEAQGTGVDFLFAPVLGVALDERWGRTYEAFAEVTELASMMGTAMVKGIQFTTTGTPTGILADAKHYLGDGGTKNGITGGQVSGDEAALRAIHLEPFRAAVAAHVGSIMASYNSWQGVKMHINRPLLTDTLKGELGFGGFVLSDFNACFQLGLADQPGLAQCVNAGVDMFMLFQGTPATRTIPAMLAIFQALVQAGTVPQSRIDDAVRRIVAVKCEMGLFEATGKVDRTLTAAVGSATHRTLARQAVRQSLVVLKNDGALLPLPKTGKPASTGPIALGGKSADNTGNQCGGWTITWQGTTGNGVTGATSIRQAMDGVLGGATGVTYSLDGSATQGAAIGVAVIGETPYAEGMGDRTDLALAAADVAVVRNMKQAGLKTVVVLIAGRPMIIDTILPYADAIVVAWLPGSEGAGITDVLFGDAHPSGKLPHSWPRSMAQLPINFGDATYDPLYPFGFGLTY